MLLVTHRTIHIVPAAAIGIAPVIVPDIYNRNQPDHAIKNVHWSAQNSDPRTWFYVPSC